MASRKQIACFVEMSVASFSVLFLQQGYCEMGALQLVFECFLTPREIETNRERLLPNQQDPQPAMGKRLPSYSSSFSWACFNPRGANTAVLR